MRRKDTIASDALLASPYFAKGADTSHWIACKATPAVKKASKCIDANHPKGGEALPVGFVSESYKARHTAEEVQALQITRQGICKKCQRASVDAAGKKVKPAKKASKSSK